VPDGNQFDRLFEEGETFPIGGLEARMMHTPGHAPACAWETMVANQRAANIHVHDGPAEDAFVDMWTACDKRLSMPVPILPSIQVNMRADDLPPPEANGIRYLKIPLDLL